MRHYLTEDKRLYVRCPYLTAVMVNQPWLLLNSWLLCGTTGTILYYAGDFDIKGLSIAQSLQMRYPHAFKDWRMNKEQYLRYLMKGIPLSEGEKHKLRYIEYTWAQDLGCIMADKGFKLHQELWVEELVSDWLNSN
jgi:hypothetical protein